MKEPFKFNGHWGDIKFRHLFKLVDPTIDASTPLPTTTICVLCRKPTLRVYYDLKYRMEWCFCCTCGVSGHPLELLRRTWKDPVLATTLTRVDAYLQEMPQTRLKMRLERILNHIGTCAGFLKSIRTLKQSNYETFDDILEELKVPKCSRALKKPWSRLIYGCTRRHVAETPLKQYLTAERGSKVICRNTKMLLVPCEDHPGRVVGFQLYFTHNNRKLVSAPIHRKSTLFVNFGNAVLSRAPEIVFTPQLETVYAAEVRFHESFNRSVNMVGIIPGEEPTTAIRAVLGKATKQVYWDTHISKDLVDLCIANSGLLNVRTRWHNSKSTAQNIQLIAKEAQPWEFVLSQYVLSTAPEIALRFITQLRAVQNHAMSSITSCLSLLAQDHLKQAHSTQINPVMVADKLITRAGTNLYANKTHISNVIPLITKVHLTAEPYLEGNVLYDVIRIPFRVSQRVLFQDGYQWLCGLLLSRNIIPYVHPSWRDHLALLGRLFGNPVLVHSQSRIGFDTKSNVLTLGNYTLAANKPPCAPSVPLHTTLARIQYPSAIPKFMHLQPLNSDVNRHLPAILSIMSFVVAVALRRRYGSPPNVALIGEHAVKFAKEAAKLFDIPIFTKLDAADATRLQEHTGNDWPVMVFPRGQSVKQVEDFVAKSDNPAIIVYPSQRLRLSYVVLSRTCGVIDLSGIPYEPIRPRLFHDILPAYLDNLASRGFEFTHQVTKDRPTVSAFYDVRAWWKSLGNEHLSAARPIQKRGLAFETGILHLICAGIKHNRMRFRVYSNSVSLLNIEHLAKRMSRLQPVAPQEVHDLIVENKLCGYLHKLKGGGIKFAPAFRKKLIWTLKKKDYRDGCK